MKKLAAALMLFILLSGCEDNPGPAEEGLGTISGRVYLVDDSLNYVVPKDVQVSLKGTNFSTLSAENGYWEIENVPTGIYTIKYSKAGFMTMKDYSVQFTGSGNYFSGYRALGEIPPVTVTELDLTNDSLKIYIRGRVSAPTSGYNNQRIISVYYAKDPIVIQPEMIFDFITHTWVYPDSVGFDDWTLIDDNEKITYDLQSGEKLYAISTVVPSAYGYYNRNPITGKFELDSEGITFSNIDSVYVP